MRAEKCNQTVEWYDYYWRQQLITGVTIHNITSTDGHIEGEWHKADGYVQHVSLLNAVWRQI